MGAEANSRSTVISPGAVFLRRREELTNVVPVFVDHDGDWRLVGANQVADQFDPVAQYVVGGYGKFLVPRPVIISFNSVSILQEVVSRSVITT